MGEEDRTPTLCMGVTGIKVICFLRSRLRLCITEGASFHTLPRVRGRLGGLHPLALKAAPAV